MTLVQTEPKSIKIWTTAIKKVTIRPNGTEKQIRPVGWGWWQPWANTIAYLKLEADTNDSSGNWNNGTPTNITYTQPSGVSKNVAVLNWSWWKIDFSSSLVTGWTFTISLWVYWNMIADGTWLNMIMWNAKSDAVWYYTDRYWTRLRSFINSTASVETTNLYSQYQWFLYTFSYSNWTMKWYKNASLIWTATKTLSSSDTRNFFIWYRAYSSDRYWNWYISDFIVESKVRTAQEITDYYDLTKWDYWIQALNNNLNNNLSNTLTPTVILNTPNSWSWDVLTM